MPKRKEITFGKIVQVVAKLFHYINTFLRSTLLFSSPKYRSNDHHRSTITCRANRAKLNFDRRSKTNFFTSQFLERIWIETNQRSSETTKRFVHTETSNACRLAAMFHRAVPRPDRRSTADLTRGENVSKRVCGIRPRQRRDCYFLLARRPI